MTYDDLFWSRRKKKAMDGTLGTFLAAQSKLNLGSLGSQARRGLRWQAGCLDKTAAGCCLLIEFGSMEQRPAASFLPWHELCGNLGYPKSCTHRP